MTASRATNCPLGALKINSVLFCTLNNTFKNWIIISGILLEVRHKLETRLVYINGISWS